MILWPVKAIFEKRAATVEVDSLISPVLGFRKVPAVLGVGVHRGRSDTAANANANSDAPRKFASEF